MADNFLTQALSAEKRLPTDPDTDGRRQYGPQNDAFAFRGAIEGGKPVYKSVNDAGWGKDAVVDKPVPTAPVLTPTPAAPTNLGRAAGAVTPDDLTASFKLSQAVDRYTGTGPAQHLAIRGQDGSASPQQLAGFDQMQKRFNAYQNNPSLLDARNAVEQLRGSGARIEKDGKGGILITNAGDFDGSTKAPYIGADGKPTTDWSKTKQYGDAVANEKKLKDLATSMESDRLRRDAFSSEITDKNVKRNAQQAFAIAAQRDVGMGKNAADAAASQLAAARFAHDLSKDSRDFAAKDEDQHNKELTAMLEREAGDPKDKDYNSRLAALQKYASQVARTDEKGNKLSAAERFKMIADERAVDDLIEKEGRHVLTPEGPSGLDAAMLNQGTAGWGSLAHFAMPGQNQYVDPRTNRTVYDRDLSVLTPSQQQLFKNRITNKDK